jgi:threonylcarbamoyladenosine tRNA methylthiotransferase MtaB
MIRVAIATLGCKTNAFESSVIAGSFTQEEYILVDINQDADLYIINTCTVTNRTDFKSRNLIRKALRRKAENPLVKVVVTGCFAQRSKDEVMALGDIDLIADNQNKLDIATLLQRDDYCFADIMQEQEFQYRPVKGMLEHSRAFQKIQDGCDCYCTYCAVPFARGHTRSARFEDVLRQASLFVNSGYKEIVLGGVNLGLYNDKQRELADVVTSMQQLDGLELIRLSSLEPQLITDQLLQAIAQSSKVCPHFHIPLQSGSDTVLSRMGRHYDTAYFRSLILRVIKHFPEAAIGLDVIVGFPGETEAEFDATLALLSELPLTYLHVFAYSKRKDTPAADMPGQIQRDIKQQRSNVLLQLSHDKTEAYKQKLCMKEIPLRGVVEAINSGVATFLSDHYIRAYTSQEVQLGSIVQIIPSQKHLDGLK